MAPKASVSKAARAVASASAEPAAAEPSGAIVLAIAAPNLADLEQVIASGLRTFIDVGQALTKIRDGKLYEATHATFELYVAERWEMRRTYAHYLIESAAVVHNCERAKLAPPTKESHARELARLPAKEQPKAWAQAVKSAPAGGVTAQHVAKVVAARLPERAAKAKGAATPATAAVPAEAAPLVVVVLAPVKDEPAALAELNEEIERRLLAWTWTAEGFASTLETWAQMARAGIAEKAS